MPNQTPNNPMNEKKPREFNQNQDSQRDIADEDDSDVSEQDLNNQNQAKRDPMSDQKNRNFSGNDSSTEKKGSDAASEKGKFDRKTA